VVREQVREQRQLRRGFRVTREEPGRLVKCYERRAHVEQLCAWDRSALRRAREDELHLGDATQRHDLLRVEQRAGLGRLGQPVEHLVAPGREQVERLLPAAVLLRIGLRVRVALVRARHQQAPRLRRAATGAQPLEHTRPLEALERLLADFERHGAELSRPSGTGRSPATERRARRGVGTAEPLAVTGRLTFRLRHAETGPHGE
jgi:hypothetical protein